MEVDHRNHDTLDNKDNNLRICKHIENCRNIRKRSGCTSKHKGVSWHKKLEKWIARIMFNKAVYLGSFKNEIDAAEAYNQAALKYFGEFANLNNIL